MEKSKQKLVVASVLAVSALAASLLLMQDIYLQIFAMWIAFEAIIRNLFHVDPHPLKTLLSVVVIVTATRVMLFCIRKPSKTRERFGDDTLSDCQVQIDLDRQRMFSSDDENNENDITKTLDSIDDLSKALEDFLHVNKPDGGSAGPTSMKNPV